MTVVTTPAVLLRSFNYGDTSRILRLYTPDLGLVGVIAKGLRRGGRGGGSGLGTFARGELTVYVRPTRELQTFKEFSVREAGIGLGRDVLRFAAASVLADLVLAHAGSDPNPRIYEHVTRGLGRLEHVAAGDVMRVLLNEGWMLVSAIGYEPHLEGCVRCGRGLGATDLGRFDFEAGGVRCPSCSAEAGGPLLGAGARGQLETLLAGPALASVTKPRAHLRLLHDFALYHLSAAKPLQSFRFLASVAERGIGTAAGQAGPPASADPPAGAGP